MKDNNIILCLILGLFLLTVFFIQKNPDCPLHVDYIQYVKSINSFYETGVLSDPINGKYFYTYLMAILLTPAYLLKLNLFDGLVLITTLFQLFLIYLFWKYTYSLLKTSLMATTLTFLTFLGHAETIMLGSIFLMLYFMFRNRPWSEFFIMLAALIRIDFAIFYLFSRNKRAIIPITFTFLQWLNGSFFLHSDLGLNPNILGAVFIFFLSYGMHLLVFTRVESLNKAFYKLDCLLLFLIVVFFMVFLKFPTQKIFFFPVLLSFLMFNFDWGKIFKWLVIPLITLNLLFAFSVQWQRASVCTPSAFYEFSINHNESIYFGVLQPYLDYHGKTYLAPYSHEIAINCKNTTDTFEGEDWRNTLLVYIPNDYCIKEYSE